jgi:hypothetical protein
MATLSVIEKSNHWHGEGPTQEVLSKLEKNPFGVFSVMRLDAHNSNNTQQIKSQSYNRQKILKHFKSFNNPVAIFESKEEAPIRLYSLLASNDLHNLADIRISNQNLVGMRLEGRLIRYAHELAALFPHFEQATIRVNTRMNQFYHDHNLDWLPPCFNDFLNWYHLLSPAAYEPYFDREELLNAPFFEVGEIRINGINCIEIISFNNPAGFTQEPEDTANRIIQLSEYLNQRRHDYQPVSSTLRA